MNKGLCVSCVADDVILTQYRRFFPGENSRNNTFARFLLFIPRFRVDANGANKYLNMFLFASRLSPLLQFDDICGPMKGKEVPGSFINLENKLAELVLV